MPTRLSTPTGATRDASRRTVVVTIQHPAHVHFYKHAIRELSSRGHRVAVFAVDKDVVVDLLDAYDIEHEVLARRGPLYALPLRQASYELRLWRRARALDPDVMTAIGGVAVSHVARLVGARSVVFTDTEHASLSNAVAFPFADVVLTPESYEDEHANQERYPGCHELAYLHPARFDPDPDVVRAAGVDPTEPYVVLRHGGWGALHDVGDSGLDGGDGAGIVAMVEAFENEGVRVLLTSEDDHPPAVADRALDVEPTRMHDLLAYADVFVGESGTMSLEAAVLGTPAVYVHTARPGIVAELAESGLLFPYHGDDRHRRAMERALSLLRGDADWDARREAFLADAVDTTDLLLDRLLT